MSTPRMRRVTSVLLAALREPESQRNDFVRHACGEDEEIAVEVLDLLQHEDVSASAVPSSVSAEQLLKRIQQSELSSADEIARFWRQIDDAQRPSSGSQLALHLLREGKLTPFQASVLVDDTRDPLVLASYEILDHIADGGMGRVYKARHRLMHRTVAIKLLSKDAIDSPNSARRFRREVQLAAQLNHENIVQAFDAAEVDGKHLLAMEYVDGIDLSRIVRRVGPLPVAQALDYILQAARGLSYAHSRGVIHRDVKPSNILVDQHDTVKILDLGLARIDATHANTSATQEELTRDNLFFGTLNYLAPEQATDPKTADHRADIYSLGCTLFYLLTGSPVYEAESPTAKIVAHREQPVPSLCDACSEIPKSLDALFKAMLAKAPGDRISSMGDVIEKLEAILSEMPAESARVDWRNAVRNEIGRASASQEANSITTASFQKSSTDTNAVAKTVVETQRPVQSPSRRRAMPFAAAALLMLAVGAVLAVVVIQMQTPQGVVVVALEDVAAKDVVVHVDEEKIDVKRLDDGTAIAISVDPGRRSLKIETSDGLKYFAREIEIERNGTSFLTAKLQTTRIAPEQSVKVASDEAAGMQSTEGDERSVAVWLRGFDAILRVIKAEGDSEQEIYPDEPLPGGPFHIVAVKVINSEDFTNRSVARLKSLPFLYDVYLEGVVLDDEAISVFATMPQLSNIHVARARITGSTLGELTKLKELINVSLPGNPLVPDNIAALQEIKSLQWLALQETHLDDRALESLSNADGLTSLDISANPIRGSGLAALRRSKGLTRLSVWSTNLDDVGLATIADTFTSLQILFAVNTRVTDDGLANLTRLPDLNFLDLRDNPQLTNRGVENLTGALQLNLINLANSSISDDAVSYIVTFPKLQHLYLSGTEVSDECIDMLRHVELLKELHIGNTAVTKNGFSRLRRELPQCQVVWSPRTADSYNRDFAREFELAELVTGRNQSAWIQPSSDDTQSHEIKELSNLPGEPFYVVSADLSHSQDTTDSLLARFRGMPKLKDLHLANTPVGDVGMMHIATMKALVGLKLDGTRVTSAGLQHLSQLPHLQSISVENIALQNEDLRLLPNTIRALSIGYTGITKLSSIDHLDKLVNLSLAGLQLDDGELRRVIVTGRFAQVKTMHLADSNVSDADVDQLSTLSQLEHLNIYNTHITQAGYDRLKQALPNCEFEWK